MKKAKLQPQFFHENANKQKSEFNPIQQMKNFKRLCGLFFQVFLLPLNDKHQPPKKKNPPPATTKKDKEKMSQNSLTQLL